MLRDQVQSAFRQLCLFNVHVQCINVNVNVKNVLSHTIYNIRPTVQSTVHEDDVITVPDDVIINQHVSVKRPVVIHNASTFDENP